MIHNRLIRYVVKTPHNGTFEVMATDAGTAVDIVRYENNLHDDPWRYKIWKKVYEALIRYRVVVDKKHFFEVLAYDGYEAIERVYNTTAWWLKIDRREYWAYPVGPVDLPKDKP